jgi:hypothetical protein
MSGVQIPVKATDVYFIYFFKVQKFIDIMSSHRGTIIKKEMFLTEAYKLRNLTLVNNAAS